MKKALSALQVRCGMDGIPASSRPIIFNEKIYSLVENMRFVKTSIVKKNIIITQLLPRFYQ